MNSAIIVAAGSGKRFGAEKPKQFLELCGKPVIAHTLTAFENCDRIDEIVLVLAENELDNFRKITAQFDFAKLRTVVAGGEARAASVWNGLNAISANAEIVAVHDGARPLVSLEEITRTIEKARETGAAILVASVTDTVKEITGDKIIGTIERTRLRRALTPQCFRAEILRRAYEKFTDLNETATDESFLVEKLGIAVSIVEGNQRNIKITVPEDLILAEALLKNRP
ncbi:MAG: 2-C-methyl-D-erythritol 4-phosphate cytidylyltransferase [Acidobacteriota bacterium]|nr:2-C-methyl-D-erythritol 4-phosphate cytidylyltransferase [Acidobacteriota bacterium]